MLETGNYDCYMKLLYLLFLCPFLMKLDRSDQLSLDMSTSLFFHDGRDVE